jgi:hypothetical protein
VRNSVRKVLLKGDALAKRFFCRRWCEKGTGSILDRENLPKSAVDSRIQVSPVPSGRGKCAKVRTVFEFPAENAEIADCVAERGGFEPPRPFRICKGGIRSKFGALFGPKKSIIAGENLRSDSALFRISPVPLIRKADEMNLVTALDLYG